MNNDAATQVVACQPLPELSGVPWLRVRIANQVQRDRSGRQAGDRLEKPVNTLVPSPIADAQRGKGAASSQITGGPWRLPLGRVPARGNDPNAVGGKPSDAKAVGQLFAGGHQSRNPPVGVEGQPRLKR